MKTLTKKDIEAFRERGYHVARGVFDGDEIARLREGYDYILELAARTDLPDAILQGKDREVHIHLQTPGPMVGHRGCSVSAKSPVAFSHSSLRLKRFGIVRSFPRC